MEWAKKTRRYGRRALVLPALLLMASLLAGCAGSDDTPVGGQEQEAMIRVSADVWRVMEGTRATTYDNTNLQSGSFKCYAYHDGTTNLYINGSTVSWNSTQSEWLFDDGTHRWPSTGALNFFAFMPEDMANTHCTFDPDGYSEGSPRIVCTGLPVDITSNSDDTQELICAYTPNQTKAAQGVTGVTMTFKRPFARVCFKLSAESGSHVIVNSITIPAIYRDGLCTFNGEADPQTFTWSSLADNDEGLVISAPSVRAQATDDSACYLVIPYNYGTKTFTVNATWDDWSNVTKNVTADVTVNWQPGYSYTYTLTLSKYALKVGTEKFTEQW